ncbi:MAG TPA: CAP domain-containing protein [Actinomycetota bacterium]|nr:CAP domain-containing protein [Actinomycetota bacterium]
MVVVAVLVAGMSSTAHADDLPRRNNMLQLLNQTRRNHGLATFRLNAQLSHFAWLHSKRMANRNQIFHTNNLYDAVRAYHPSTWGENVGKAGRLTRVRSLWMHSSGHRANILKARYRRIGIGVVKARGAVWVTAIFYGG